MRYVPPDHFRTGVWAPTGPLRLAHYTCVECARRTPSWPAFKAHRAACPGHMTTPPPMPLGPTLGADDLDRLADLYEQLHAETGEGGA